MPAQPEQILNLKLNLRLWSPFGQQAGDRVAASRTWPAAIRIRSSSHGDFTERTART